MESRVIPIVERVRRESVAPESADAEQKQLPSTESCDVAGAPGGTLSRSSWVAQLVYPSGCCLHLPNQSSGFLVSIGCE